MWDKFDKKPAIPKEPSFEEFKPTFVCTCCHTTIEDKWDTHRCGACSRIVCKDCAVYTGSDDPENCDESHAFYCPLCWAIGDEYRDRIQQLKENIWDVIREWDNECIRKVHGEDINV